MLIAGGDRYDKIVTWGSVTTSLDGLTWTTPTEPFPTRAKVTGITHGPDVIMAVSDSGLVSVTPIANIAWNSYKVWEGDLAAMSVSYATDLVGNNGIYMMCGQGKFLTAQSIYGLNDEAGLIFSNDSSNNELWRMIYAHDGANSRFYNIRRITDPYRDVWIAVGSSDSKPLAIYSTDNGVNWENVYFPDVASIKFAYDVMFNEGLFWFTVNGMVLNTPSLDSPVWGASPSITPTYGSGDLIKIAANPAGHMVAVCSGGIFYSTDCVGWTLLSQPGYRFRSIAWHIDRWVAGAESNLTQYTYWHSQDTINWTPGNNKVQAYDFVKV